MVKAEYILSSDAPRSIIIQGDGNFQPFITYMGGEILDTLDGELCEIPFTKENALKLREFLKGKDYHIPEREKKTIAMLADSENAIENKDLRWSTKLTDLQVNKLPKKLGKIATEWDLIHYLPLRYMDKSNPQNVSELVVGEWAVVAGTIVNMEYNPYNDFVKIVISDIKSQRVSATFFRQKWLHWQYKEGDEVVIYGNYSQYVNKRNGAKFPQITNPKIDRIQSVETARYNGLGMVPIYPQKSQNRSWAIKNAQEILLDNIVWIEDPVPAPILTKYGLISRTEAFKKIHFPNDRTDVEAARRRIAFDEFIRLQVYIRGERETSQSLSSSRKTEHAWADRFVDSLPFEFTGAQTRVVKEILNDLNTNIPMYRLLQGDVGSGKAQPLTSLILTPGGFKTMGDILPGDKVVTPSGVVETVISIHPQGDRPVYELNFRDGVKVQADANHIWEVKEKYNGPVIKKTTIELLDNPGHWFINLPERVENYGTEWSHQVNPYEYGKHVVAGENNNLLTFPNLSLLNTTKGARLSLLQGIMDTAGFTVNGSTYQKVSFIHENQDLVELVANLFRSLNGYAEQTLDKNGLHKMVGWLPPKLLPFRKNHKGNKVYNGQLANPTHMVNALTKITYIGEQPTKCIYITGKTHLYITDGFTITHNTEISSVASLATVESGYQVALLAPTDILATQLYDRLKNTFKKTGLTEEQLHVSLFTGKVLGKKRTQLLEDIKNHKTHVIVGTHALVGKNVEFANLGLAIVDEQHKFGVEQRSALKRANSDGSIPDMLTMSATPIPRATAQVIYGDMDISIVDELPAERIPIHTEWHETPDVAWGKIREEVDKGQQAYVVAALVEDSDKIENVESAIATHSDLQNRVFPDLNVGLLHGKLKPAEKSEILAKFAANEYQILVATSVVEVGINVPNSTVMTILNANRFGIASLHQIRGRVGRGKLASYCYLIGEATIPEAEERLNALVASNDGFWLAEKDLEIRGEGSLFGRIQSGDSDLYVGNLREHRDLLEIAKKVAKMASSSVILKQEIKTLYAGRTILS